MARIELTETPNGGDTPLQRPNVLWIGVDQMRQDSAGCYGNEVCSTPNIDRLASEGQLFTNAYTSCPLCTPARASMFTGCFAFKHGMGTNSNAYHVLSEELPKPGLLLHHRLREQGYHCGYAGKWHMGENNGPVDYGFEGMNLTGYGDLRYDAGYQQYLEESNLSYGPIKDPIYGNWAQQTLLAGHWNGPIESAPPYYLASYTMEMLDRFAANRQPFFITCQFWGPHGPYLPSPEFAGKHDRSALQPWINFLDDYKGKPQSVRRFNTDFYRELPNTWEGWREIVGLCYDFTSEIDAQIGRILTHLDELELAEDTIVIFASDHGDMLGSHAGLYDKGYMYQENYRIPLIVRWPGRVRLGTRCDELVYNMDVLPTMLDVLGQRDDQLDGKSFLPFLDDVGSAGREAIYLEFHGLKYLYSQRAVLTRDGYKYIFTPGDQDEFYDLSQDPGELHNVIAEAAYQERVEDLRKMMMDIAAQFNDPLRDCICKVFGHWEKASNAGHSHLTYELR